MITQKIYLACFVFILFSTFTGCSAPIPSKSEFVLGTICTITLFDKGKPQIYRDIFNRLREIENRMSVNIQGTDIDRINEAAGREAVKVNDDVCEVIERAIHFAEYFEGALDLTVGPLVTLWDIDGENSRVPGKDEIVNVLPLVNWREVEINREHKTVFLKKPGMSITLGAIAKGYAADEAAEIIRKAGIPRAIIDLGGNILTVGKKTDNSPWRVGIQNPLESRGSFVGIAQVKEKTVVTSGVYERFFEADGISYHHIFDPTTGYPAKNNLLSVTIISDCSMDADALSTAIFVLGYERGRVLVESLEGVEAIFILEDMRVRKTPGADFVLTDEAYRIEND
jgi:thiamine biosynthesis lipoprotein